MASFEITIDNAIGKIKTLTAESKWVEAHRACLELLRYDPENIKVIRLKNLVEKSVRKQNILAIKEDLKNLMPLVRAKKYEEVLSYLKELEPFMNDYRPLKKFIIKTQSRYNKGILVQQKIYFEEQKKNIDKLLNQRQYKEALTLAENMIKSKIKEQYLKALVEKIKLQWINDELGRNEALLKTENYEDILLFLQSLKSISGKNAKLNSMIDKFNKKNKQHKVELKKDYIFSGTEKIRTLMQLKKYESACEAAAEILNIDPGNTQVRKMYVQAMKKEMKKMNQIIYTQIKEARKKMQKHRAEEPQNYIKL